MSTFGNDLGHRRTLAGRTAAVCLAAACVLLMLPAITLAQTPAVPAVPLGLTATSGDDGTMTLEWNSATDANGGYDYRYTTNAAYLFICNPTDDTTQYACTGIEEGSTAAGVLTFTFRDDEALTVGETYFFQVRGRNTNGNVSDWSATASGFQRAPAPQMLTTVTVTAGDTEVTLAWDAPPVGDAVINYAYGQSDPNNPWSWQSFSTTTNSYVVTGLTNGVLYSFQVRAHNFPRRWPAVGDRHCSPDGAAGRTPRPPSASNQRRRHRSHTELGGRRRPGYHQLPVPAKERCGRL